MKFKHTILLGAVLGSLSALVSPAFAQSTAFTYQGRLNESANPANGVYDLKFSLHDTVSGGSEPSKTAYGINVTNGLFTVTLDFGEVFSGADRWLEIGVRTNGGTVFDILDPRQPITAAPYSTYALAAGTAATAGSASNVVSGSVISSVNNLKDDIILEAGTNVTITPNGNTLTIASTGAGGSGIWSLNGTNTYYSAGKVGIGTTTPSHRLSIAGGPYWTANLWKGAIDLESAAAIAWRANSGGQRFGIGQSSGGLYFFRTTSDPGTTATDANYDMAITDNGNVIIANGTERPGVKLQVNGGAAFGPMGSGGEVAFGSPNGETGMTIIGNARADIRFDGLALKLLAGPVGGPPSALSGVAITTGGSVGIGITTPSSKLDVVTTGDSIYGRSTGGGIGVYGTSSGFGLYGSGTGNGEGVRGVSSTGAAVNGTSSGGGIGVYGSSSGYAGYFNGTVNVTGAQAVQGRLFAYAGVDATGGASYSAIFAHNSSGGLAGQFIGNVSVNGNLSKGSGSFKIDHPLDPTNKYLYHSFVESPDMMNIYNGNVALDEAGESVVQMPEWFDALNKDFRYQLTAIGAPGPNLHIVEEIVGNQFRIAGGKPGTKVSWQVTGVRQDAFANANRIKVEEEKTGNERGSYLHPEVFGQPVEKNVLKSGN